MLLDICTVIRVLPGLVLLSMLGGCASVAPDAGPEKSGTSAPSGEQSSVIPHAYSWWQSECRGSSPCPTPPGSQFAILDFRSGPFVLQIDGARVKEDIRKRRWIALSPGEHTINYGGIFFYSQGYLPLRRELHNLAATIDFEAGHVYETMRERDLDREDHMRIQNTTTGEIVHGAPPADRRELMRRSERARAKRITQQQFEKLSSDARCGDSNAQRRLALYYLAGLEPVGRRDLVHAYAWYARAAADGDAPTDALKERIGAEMLPEQLARARLLSADARLHECSAAPSPRRETAGGKAK